MPDDNHARWAELIAAAVTESLEPAEAAELDAHTANCRTCQQDLRELAAVSAALRGNVPIGDEPVDPADLPEAGLADRVVMAVGRARRREHITRRLTFAVAASAACLAFLAIGVALPEPAGPPQEPVAVAAAEGVDAKVALVVHTWGTEVKLVASGLRQGETYGVTVVTDDGARVVAGTFLGVDDRPIVCDMNAAVMRDDAAALEVVDAAGEIVMSADLS